MQLHLWRSQVPGKMGTTKFRLAVQVKFGSQESELVQKYGLVTQTVATGTRREGLVNRVDLPYSISVGQISAGVAQEFESLGDMLDFEDTIKESIDNLGAYLVAAMSFGGQEVIDFPLDEQLAAASTNRPPPPVGVAGSDLPSPPGSLPPPPPNAF